MQYIQCICITSLLIIIQIKMPKLTKSNNIQNAIQVFSWTINKHEACTDIEFKILQPIIKQWCETYGKKFNFSLERGKETERLHYQGWIKTIDRWYPDKLINNLEAILAPIVPRSFIHLKHGHAELALCKYTTKQDGTHVEGPWNDESYNRNKERDFDEKKAYSFQLSIIHMISQKAKDDGIIHWICDPEGRTGKTTIIRHCYRKYDCMFGVYADTRKMLSLVAAHQDKKGFLFNLTRCKPSDVANDDLYATLESIKDGLFLKTEYNVEAVDMPCVHVIVFANNLPKTNKLSKGRWAIYKINDNKELEWLPDGEHPNNMIRDDVNLSLMDQLESHDNFNWETMSYA